MEIFSLESLVFFSTGILLFSSISHYSKSIHFLPEVIWMLIFGILYGIFQRYTNFIELPELSINPNLILYVFVPLLIFASSQKICLFHFRKVLTPTVVLATLGVIISMLIIAWILNFIYAIPLLSALLFWVIISATDPLAVWAILSKNKNIPESKKLLIEGESILNDGFVVTVFGILGLILFKGHSLEILSSGYEFLYHIVVALGIWILFGRLIRYILKVWHEEYFALSVNMTILLAFASFILTEELGASGIIAVFAAALAYGYKPDMENHNKDIHKHIWEYIEYIANSILFFLLWAAFITQGHIWDISLTLIFSALGILVLARAIALAILLPLLKFEGTNFSKFDFELLHLSGSRWAVSIALILLLPESFQYKDFFLTLAFLIIIFSLIINPLILQKILKK